MKDLRKEILDFWFVETAPRQWFQVNEDFDAQVKAGFEDVYERVAAGANDAWQNDSDGALALCLVLDQMPRNMFRGTPKAFETDKKALIISKYAIAKSLDQVHSAQKKSFIYMPFMHSENLSDQRRAVELFEKTKEQNPMGYDYAQRHYKVIEEFSRFPHRNEILGRESTPDEQAYLERSDSGF